MKLLNIGDKVKIILAVDASPEAKHLKNKEGVIEEKVGNYFVVRVGKRTAFIFYSDLEALV